MVEYRIAKGWGVFMYVMAVGLFGGGLATIVLPAIEGGNGNLMPLLIGIGALLMLLGVYMGLAARKWRVVVSEEGITEYDVFKNRHLAFTDIKGYTANDKYVFIKPVDKSKPTIKLHEYIGKRKELTDWVATHFIDLDEVERQASIQEILQDETFGSTEEQRLEKLEQAGKVAKVFNALSGALVCWAFFYPQPYQWVCLACLLFPVVALVPYYYYQGLIKLDDTQAKAYPTLIGALLIAPMGATLRMLIDFEILEYGNIWLPASVFALCIMGVLYLNRKAVSTTGVAAIFVGLFMAAMAFAYGYGASVFYNCYYDKSVPVSYPVKVSSKDVSNGKTTTYYFNVEPWGKYKSTQRYSVDEALYNNTAVDDTVTLYLMEGKLHVPWVIITQ
jgi:hypothetical protein